MIFEFVRMLLRLLDMLCIIMRFFLSLKYTSLFDLLILILNFNLPKKGEKLIVLEYLFLNELVFKCSNVIQIRYYSHTS
ncbi:hypothetical protein BpHYR1_008187 [Brachionus plicatilis]|uniref:Uncharacterized protein n=1 Tax=Brachionus plicatilis TaxID=10195 RepID=A0A3M7SSE6_BRAPC|nr:hypothetical protein BpHYR1_008187 [Brachionus plicatilis]